MRQFDLSYLVEDGRNYAHFLPSISEDLVSSFSKKEGEKKDSNQKTLKEADLNFLRKDAVFHYPKVMYSFGTAQNSTTKDPQKFQKRNMGVLSRHSRDTFILADSGGFQVFEGTIEIDWDAPDDFLKRNIKWQKSIANVGMYLDVPSRAVKKQFVKKKENRFFNNHELTLETSLRFYENMNGLRGSFPMVKPLHGENAEQAISWYEKVKHVPCAGYAIAAPLNKRLDELILLLQHIILDGGLKGMKHLHIFGQGAPIYGVVLTALQRVLCFRLQDNAMQLTYDCSTPLSSLARNEVYLDEYHGPILNVPSPGKGKMFKLAETLCGQAQFPYASSPVLSRLVVDDIVSREPNRPMSFKGLGHTAIVAHNIYKHIELIHYGINTAYSEYNMLRSLDGYTRKTYSISENENDHCGLGKSESGLFIEKLYKVLHSVLCAKNYDAARKAVHREKTFLKNCLAHRV